MLTGNCSPEISKHLHGYSAYLKGAAIVDSAAKSRIAVELWVVFGKTTEVLLSNDEPA